MQKQAIKILGALLLMTACNSAVLEPRNMGSIILSLSSDIEIEARTKTDGMMDCSDFTVFIEGTTLVGNNHSVSYRYGDMTGKENIPFGVYTVSAESCTEQEAAPEGEPGCARYAGATSDGEVSVRSEEPVPVVLTCHMANAKASVYLDESFTKDFTDITASLTMDDSRTVTAIDSENTAGGREIYFNVPETGGALVYTIKGTVAGKRLTYTNESSPIMLEPAKWAKITIKSNHNGIIGVPGIDVDETLKDNYITEVIDPEDGSGIDGGEMKLPSIKVSTKINDVEVIECELDIY